MVHQNRSLRQARAGAVVQRLNDLEQRVTALRQAATAAHEEQTQIETHARQLLTQNDGLATLDATLKIWHASETAEFEAVRKQADAVQSRLDGIKSVMRRTVRSSRQIERQGGRRPFGDRNPTSTRSTGNCNPPKPDSKRNAWPCAPWTLEREKVRSSSHE